HSLQIYLKVQKGRFLQQVVFLPLPYRTPYQFLLALHLLLLQGLFPFLSLTLVPTVLSALSSTDRFHTNTAHVPAPVQVPSPFVHPSLFALPHSLLPL